MMIVPTLRVGMQPGTLRVPRADAERPVRHSHAERGNDQSLGFHKPCIQAVLRQSLGLVLGHA